MFAPIAPLEFGHAAINLGMGILLAMVWTIAPLAILAALVAPALALSAYRSLRPRASVVRTVAPAPAPLSRAA